MILVRIESESICISSSVELDNESKCANISLILVFFKKTLGKYSDRFKNPFKVFFLTMSCGSLIS